MERILFLGISRNFSASIGSFQGLPAEVSEVILLSQRLALKYNTTPRVACQHFLTSFFQILCRGGLGAKLQPQRTLSGIATRCQIPPFVTCGDIFPRPGEICPLGGSFIGADRKMHKSSPFRGSWRAAPERVRPYIITLYRQCETQTGIDCGLYYPPESVLRCQEFPCKILSRKISAIFGDCYKTQNIVVSILFSVCCYCSYVPDLLNLTAKLLKNP